MQSEKQLILPHLEFISNLKLSTSATIPHDSDLALYVMSTPADLGEAPAMTVCEKIMMEAPLRELIQSHVNRVRFTAEAGAVHIIPNGLNKAIGVAGMGCMKTHPKYLAHSVAEAGYKMGAAAVAHGAEKITIVLQPCCTGLQKEQIGLIGVMLKRFMQALVPNDAYKGTDAKKKNEKNRRVLKEIVLASECTECHPHLEGLAKRAQAIAFGSRYAAALVDSPPSRANCVHLAENVKEMIKGKNLTLEILEEKQCAELKMGAFLGVARGAGEARVIHITYKNGTPTKKIAFVGKGITFDTGGYSLKPSTAQLTMKCDMAGAATVLGTALTLADLQVPNVEVHFIAMCCANLVSSKSYLVSDVITAANGKTIDVQNTDAEGRLALADGLIYAEKQLGGPGQGTIIDIATLTGAQLIALGEEIAAVLSHNEELMEKAVEASKESGELVHELPLYPKYKDLLKAKTADILNANMANRNAGTITAGLFLNEFVSKETPYLHVDGAGPLWSSEEGGTGFGVQFFTHLVENLSKV
eukprot:Protomagalhaensia_sp_Gyna_25__2997@NODE_276_length_4070_cov_1995_065989_g212_i0_p2_GENE_NODE_276_length_4070_cov_1995_065989_g212_i0NODE_276_length_4070_cov_1995_065989_g212_i0_p2_ORF_typecomplete_len529_score110_12Peptidase_M17/PF00883_21/9_6e03Peptidase_M17/PF00883_21/7_2e102Peptidase_M17_N/PF02789_17/0_018Peptidase_M17_N/PF02789_17/1e03Ribosomal_L44/PF00935_19/2_5e03Ribosomal_L44/PF00935_19/0_26_NODE_276_length_4070_cov_1995_065989_g212_i01231709